MPKAHVPTDTLTIDVRDAAGTTSAKALRRAGNIPGVLYGHGAPTPISLSVKALEDLLTHGNKSHILDATIAGKHDSVLLRAVQRDPVSHRPIHADFQRVSKGEAVHAHVPIVLIGSSAAVKDGAVLDIVSRSIEVKGAADKIPDNITIDITPFGVHSHLSAADIKLPTGFVLVTPPDQVILSIEPSRTAQQAEEDVVAAEPLAPLPEPAPAAPDAG